MRLSLIVPIYKSRDFIPGLINVLSELNRKLEGTLTVTFVVDGSPDDSYPMLREALPKVSFSSELVLLSRNFGAFPAILRGFCEADADHYAVMAADMQEPPELVLESFEKLQKGDYDICIGQRTHRRDPLHTRLASGLFWWVCRRFIEKDLPVGGVDIFACNRLVRDHLVSMPESCTSLVLQLYWLGFRRTYIPYERAERKHGKSGWSFSRKFRYMIDSIFGFTDLPIRMLAIGGALGVLISLGLMVAVLVAYFTGQITVLGYAPIMLTITFFSALQILSIAILGAYIWRVFDNTKQRPVTVMMRKESFDAKAGQA